MIIFLSVDFTEHQNAYFAFGADRRSEKKRIFLKFFHVLENRLNLMESEKSWINPNF
jgi:hypothetical protein